MSKKHYIAIAAILKDSANRNRMVPAAINSTTDIARQLADYFASENERFTRERFLAACGV